MALSKSTKYGIANVALGVLLYLAFRLYYDVMFQPRNGSKAKEFILLALAIYILASVIIVMRAYYRSGRFSTVHQSERAAELHAQGLLAADRLRKITIHLTVSSEEYKTLEETRELVLPPERFNMPIRFRDTVEISTGEGSYQRHTATIITDIDGVNQRVTLKRQV